MFKLFVAESQVIVRADYFVIESDFEMQVVAVRHFARSRNADRSQFGSCRHALSFRYRGFVQRTVNGNQTVAVIDGNDSAS